MRLPMVPKTKMSKIVVDLVQMSHASEFHAINYFQQDISIYIYDFVTHMARYGTLI